MKGSEKRTGRGAAMVNAVGGEEHKKRGARLRRKGLGKVPRKQEIASAGRRRIHTFHWTKASVKGILLLSERRWGGV